VVVESMLNFALAIGYARLPLSCNKVHILVLAVEVVPARI